MKRKAQIIIVDDNPTFLEGIVTYLKKAIDYEIVACYHSGQSLLEDISRYRPDLILLDIEMPGLNGIETARKLNFLDAKLKLIAITLYHDNVYIKQLIEAGFRGFVSKNKVAENLHQVMDRVLRNDIVFPDIRII
ncbi:MAG: response regulator transcription factor [Bacteroidales bacterium]|nr:response regulator transcription factor [Bacteroidales bacterium]